MLPDSITCPVCRMTSHSEMDIREGYCGKCHTWTSGPLRVVCPACPGPVIYFPARGDCACRDPGCAYACGGLPPRLPLIQYGHVIPAGE